MGYCNLVEVLMVVQEISLAGVEKIFHLCELTRLLELQIADGK